MSHMQRPMLVLITSCDNGLHVPTACMCLQLHSSQEFQDVIEQNPGRLIVLMCKAQGCRPCKMFGRKFQRLAEQFEDAIFLDIMGDETNDTRVSARGLQGFCTQRLFLMHSACAACSESQC